MTVAQLKDLVEGVRELGGALQQPAQAATEPAPAVPWAQLLEGLENLGRLRPQGEVVAQPQPAVQKLLESLADTLQDSFLPLIKTMDKKIDIDLRTHNRMLEISTQLRSLAEHLGQEQRSSGEDEAPA